MDIMAAYCAAISALMEGALLNSGYPMDEALGWVRGPDPHFEIVPQRGSVLAEESGVDAGHPVRYGTSDFAQHISLRCRVSVTWGEFAWRCIACCLSEIDNSAFPRIDLENGGDGIEVRLRPPSFATLTKS